MRSWWGPSCTSEGSSSNALDRTEVRQVIEEQPIAAADVQDVVEGAGAAEPPEMLEDELFARLPPPVMEP